MYFLKEVAMINKESTANYPKFIGVRYASELGLSKYQFRKLLKNKDAPTIRWGAKLYFDRDKLFEYLEQQAQSQT